MSPLSGDALQAYLAESVHVAAVWRTTRARTEKEGTPLTIGPEVETFGAQTSVVSRLRFASNERYGKRSGN